MYTKTNLQPPGLGVAYYKIDVIMKGEVYFSLKDSRGHSRSTKWQVGGKWNNSGGCGWYVLGPLSMVKWSSE